MRVTCHISSILGCLLLLWSNGASGGEMDDLAAEAVRVNPGIEALQAQVSALEAEAAGARRWADPTISIEYSSFPWDTWSLGDSPMTGFQIKVQQTFPFPGKNDRREAAVAANTEVKRLEREELARQLAATVKQLYLELALERQLRRITEEHIRVVKDLEARVRLRYEVGKGNQHEVMQLALLAGRLEDDLKEFDRRETELTASINAALHRDVHTPIDTPAEIAIRAPEVGLERMLELAAANRPAIAALEEKTAASKLEGDRIEWERRPDFTFWIGYRFRAEAGIDDGTDFFSIGASMPIPIDYSGSTDARKRSALEKASAAESTREGALDEIAAGIERALAAWRRAVDKVATYRERLVPDARNSLDAALLAYETDRTDFSSVYRAELELVRFERTILTARAQAAKAKVAVEALIGVPLDGAGAREDR